MTKLNFGLALDLGPGAGPLAPRMDEALRLVRVAGRYGFDSVWAGEWYAEGPSPHLASPLLLLAALSQQTTLGLGTAVTILPAWNPLRLAYESALLDQLTSGRLVLGVGVGRPALWARFGTPAERMADRLDETLAALKALWVGEDGYQGELVSVRGPIWPLPLRPGGPPIWVAGRVGRSLQRAARHGDGWYAATNYRLPEIAGLAARYRAACEAANRPPGAVAANRITVVAPAAGQARHDAGSQVEALVRRYTSRGDVIGVAAETTTGLVDALAADLLLLGTPSEVNQQLAGYAAAGVTDVQVRVWPGDLAYEVAERTVTLLGKEVLPAWR